MVLSSLLNHWVRNKIMASLLGQLKNISGNQRLKMNLYGIWSNFREMFNPFCWDICYYMIFYLIVVITTTDHKILSATRDF